MAVDSGQLENDLRSLFQVANHPATQAAAAAQWASIVGSYAAPVSPVSTTVAAAQAALEPAFLSALQQPTLTALASALDAAFQAFGATVGGGMPPMSPPPPAAPPGWLVQLSASRNTYEQAASEFAVFVDTWFTSSGWS